MTTSWSGHRASFPPHIRKRILKRDLYECQLRLDGCTATATIADHIIPHAEGGAHTEANGQALCQHCHDRKTRREIQRGRARQPSRRRPQEKHPGLT